MDWSEKVLCIKCNEGGNLLVCSEDGCPLAVHEGCMGCPARYDDAGRYYCPYCFYKQAVAESRKAREYALATKKALLHFMNEKMMGSEKHIEENKGAESNGRNESTEKIIICNNGRNVNRDASLEQSMQPDKEQETGNAEEEKDQKEESEGSSGSKGQDPLPKQDDEQSITNEVDNKSQEENQSISNVEETKNQEEEHETSAASSGQNPSRNMDKDNVYDSPEEKIQEEKCETSSPSSGEEGRPTRRSKRKKPLERDSEAVSARASPAMKKKTSPTLKKKTSPTMKKKTSPTMNSPKKSSRRSSAVETRKGSNQVVDSPKRSGNVFGSGKRRRLIWTEKEEEALKEGVEIFSKEANVNIPWRKILHMGRGVFDASRTPIDLKDKWRNMLK